MKATERAIAERVRYQSRGSCSHCCRRLLVPLLAALEWVRQQRPSADAVHLPLRHPRAKIRARLASAAVLAAWAFFTR